MCILQLRRTQTGRAAAIAGLLILLLASPVSAADAAELLEKGIYTEETVGDLNEAIKVYEQVVTAGNDARKAAAEAQFRIGACYLKQGKTDQATAAFQSVVDNFPTETELVAKAKSRLPSAPELLPVPWGAGDELRMEMKLATGLDAGQAIYRVTKSQLDDREIWKCSTWQFVSLNGSTSISQVLADAKSFAPIKSQWSHSLLGDSSAIYEPGKVVINMENKDEPTTLKIDASVYDNEQTVQVFRRLPLEVGFKTDMPIIATISGAQIPLSLEVTKKEMIETPAGNFDCFCIKLNIGQTFWISDDAKRYLVRFEAGGVIVNLVSVRTNFDQPTELKLDRVSTMLPRDWFAYTPSASEPKTNTYFIEPTGSMIARMEAGPLEPLTAEHETPSAWLTFSLEEYRKTLKDFAIANGGVKTIKIGQREAAAATFTYTEKDKQMTAYRIAIFGDTSAVNLRFTASTDEFESFEPAIKSIVDALTVQ